MPDLSAVAGLVSSFRTATNITRTLLELKSMSEIQGKVIELQSVIMTAQSAALATQSDLSSAFHRIEELERELASLRGWNSEKSRYSLQAVDEATFAYVLRPEARGEEPTHWLCASCFVQDRKSILQRTSEIHGESTYQCPLCSSKIKVGEYKPPPIDYSGNPYA